MRKVAKTLILTIILFLFTVTVNAETLNCKYVYRNGSVGENVKILQKMLNEKENCELVIDGIFGRKTKECVKKYQKNNDLLVDGIVGKNTCNSLNQKNKDEKPKDENIVNKKYIVNANVNFRQGPSTSYNTYGVLSPKTEVLVLEYTNSSWYKVQYDNKIGYIYSSYLTEKVNSPLNSNDYVIISSSANIRKGPSTAYGKVTTLKRGTILKVVGSKSNWYQVEVNNKTGYIRNDLVSNDLIIVDISDQMLYYFKGTETILVAPVVTGRKGRHDTPLGNYTLYPSSKQASRYLRGYNDDGSR